MACEVNNEVNNDNSVNSVNSVNREVNNVKNHLEILEKKIDEIDLKLITILELLQNDIRPNCKKMSSHIDFVDVVYENVKNPLGYICSKVGKLTDNETYNLEDKSS